MSLPGRIPDTYWRKIALASIAVGAIGGVAISLTGCGGGSSPGNSVVRGVGDFVGSAALSGNRSIAFGLTTRRDGSASGSFTLTSPGADPVRGTLAGSLDTNAGTASVNGSASGVSSVQVSGATSAGGAFSASVNGETANGSFAVASLPPTAPFEPSYVGSLNASAPVQHWDHNPITIFVDRGVESHSQTELETAVIDAANVWSAPTGNRVIFALSHNQSAADVVVHFVAETEARLQPNRLGVTDIEYTVPGNALTHSDMIIRRNQNADQMRKTLAHEIGHAIGVNGHSPDPADVMFAIAEPPTTITIRDANTIAVAYDPATRHRAASQTRRKITIVD